MQSRIPISKPLALVIIGLVIGASLGLGSGYAVFYPDMVNKRSKTVEERITGVEENMTAMDSRISNINQSISQIKDSLNGILALTNVVDQLSSRVSTLEKGQINLSNDFSSLSDQLTQLDSNFGTIQDSWQETTNQFQDLETAYYAVNNELADIQSLVHENDGVRILKAYMANPPSDFEQKIAVEIYNALTLDEPKFENWVTLYGENTAIILLQQEVDSMAGGLVWNPTDNTAIGDNSYQIKLQTYSPFDFTPAGISVNNLHIEIRATVNIDTGEISTLQVSLVEII